MLQYYTLEQAAKLLGSNADRAKKLLDDHKVRQYRDGRGGVRYVASAVDELARTLGRGSDPELGLGEAARAKTGSTPKPSKVESGTDSPFDFDLPVDDSEVGIGKEKLDVSGGSSQRSGRGKKPAGAKSPAPKSPPPQAGSDSDVRLVTDSNDLEFQINAESDVKMVDDSDSSKSSKSGAGSSRSGKSKSARAGDSEVRIVPLDLPSDSDVRISEDEEGSVVLDRPPVKKHSDSDIRLEEVSRPAPRADEGSDDALVTEEIDLDAEQRKAAEKAKTKGSRSKMKPAGGAPALPTSSPFELSEDDIDAAPASRKPDSSSDFELTPAASDSGDDIPLSSGEIETAGALPKRADDSSEDEVALGEIGGGAGSSGINLDAPMDSGISLEGGEASGDEMEFELSLDAGSTPKPAPKSGPKSGKSKAAKAKPPKEEDSDSEFELTLDADSSAEQPVLQPPGEAAGEDSDSEFELTLDDSGGLVPLEGEKAAAPAGDQAEEADIFETDFEVPALDEESGSQAMALDEGESELESSDFDLALEEGDAASDDESGSQVVALEDEPEVDEAAETVQRPKKKGKPAARKKAAAEVESEELLAGGEEEPLEELADIDDESAVAEEEGEAPARRGAPVSAAAAAPAQWGPVPALFLLPCVVVMLLAGLMGYELINNMVGYQQPGKVSGFLTDSLAKTFDLDLPKE